jgi:hypothetical protein
LAAIQNVCAGHSTRGVVMIYGPMIGSVRIGITSYEGKEVEVFGVRTYERN